MRNNWVDGEISSTISRAFSTDAITSYRKFLQIAVVDNQKYQSQINNNFIIPRFPQASSLK